MRIQFQLSTRSGVEAPTVNATTPTAASVLAVHPRLRLGECHRRNGWTLSHIPSGRSVGVVFRTRALALAIAREFGERPEWQAVGPRGGVRNVSAEFAREFQSAVRALRARDFRNVVRAGGAS